jgi:ribose 5-phosphate isomerase A
MTNAERALDWIADGSVVGLGSGRAAGQFVVALGKRVQEGLSVVGVPTSIPTANLARQAGIPLVSMEEIDGIDITVDGADEVDPRLDLIKGWGGALVRERIVAAYSRRLVILVGSEKLVPVLGSRGKLPVEVVPFALALCKRRLAGLALPPQVRQDQTGNKPFLTDNGNYILDCPVGPIRNPKELHQQIADIPGVVGTGLFLDMAEAVLVEKKAGVEVRQRNSG